MAQPLAGVRVADFSHVIAGPLATQFLCLLGAEVIKVEPPTGDVMRYYTKDRSRRGAAEPFVGSNAGKKSVVLDLKADSGRTAAQALIKTCDIFVENFRPGVASRLGLGSEELARENPSLIYCSVSGYGQEGPHRDFPAIDQVIQSVAGLMTLSGEEGDAAQRVGFPIVDTYSALLTAFAILAAYVQRQADPDAKGQVIDVSMFDATMVMMSSVIGPRLISGLKPVRAGNRGFSGAPTADTFLTADGEITIGAVQQVQVERLFDIMGCSEFLQDPRFATPDARLDNDAALQTLMKDIFLTRSARDWELLLSKGGVPAGKVRDLDEALAFEKEHQRDLFLSVEDRVSGEPVRILNAGFQFKHDGPGTSRPAPELGEHTEEVLKSIGIVPTTAL
ncbi:CaiB/BaiF CoA transferase family protein [Roseibium sp.]|uniref:CaiB/BaiF CoA transferase family protein n=1 Tax=Roseibium sp. TaxID=1936156 RepID=UPI003A9883D9